MYNFIFYFVYKKQFKGDNNIQAVKSSGLIVSLAVGLHILLLYSIMRFCLCYFAQISIARRNSSPTSANNMAYLVLIILIFGIVGRIYSERRASHIVAEFSNKVNFYNSKSVAKFISILLVPLLISIFLVNSSVGYC